jgi:serine/threonine protein kinase
LSLYDPPESVASFPEQFLEGVALLHEHRVAHLDLKPGNVVIDGVDRDCPPRVVIIDFGLSVFVKDEHAMIKGFCGTPPCVAPEVGTRDGSDIIQPDPCRSLGVRTNNSRSFFQAVAVVVVVVRVKVVLRICS